MTSQDIAHVIAEVCAAGGAFPRKISRLYARLSPWDRASILSRLRFAGVIPEMYEHDSSEEKVYAKYCDILVAEAFKAMGLNSTVSDTRGNAADLYVEGPGYSAVCDVKAFRLSRSALNPKDYKIEAVDQWRQSQEADYALLVAPHPQFPKDVSRLYDEALRYNVTLLPVAHVEFLLREAMRLGAPPDLSPLWRVGDAIGDSAEVRGSSYWKALDAAILQATGGEVEELVRSREGYETSFRDEARLQIRYWEARLAEIQSMSRDRLVERLIEVEGIRGKIRVISQYVGQAGGIH